MAMTIVSISIVAVFGLIAVLQIYFNSATIKKLKNILRRLERIEHLLGEDSTEENKLDWSPRGTLRKPEGVVLGSLFPPLNLSTINGTKVSLNTLSGTQTLLLFLSSGCSVCTNLFERLLDYLDSAPMPLEIPSTVVVLSKGIIQRELEEDDSQGIKILQILIDDVVSQQYGVVGTPCSVILDKKGVVCDAAYISSMEELFVVAHRANSFTMQEAHSTSL